MQLCSPDWSFTGPTEARQADCGGEWRRKGQRTNKRASVRSGGGWAAGARRQRTWVWLPSDPSSSCQQWHFLTIHKQASQQRCRVLREWRTGLWVHFTTKPPKEAASYGCAHTRTPSHKHTPKAVLLSPSVQTPLLKLNRGSQSLSVWCGLNITARNSTGWVWGREVAALCGQKASWQRQFSTTSNGSTWTKEA